MKTHATITLSDRVYYDVEKALFRGTDTSGTPLMKRYKDYAVFRSVVKSVMNERMTLRGLRYLQQEVFLPNGIIL
jgi:hypothetical protein